MPIASVDLVRIRERYQTWLAENKPKFKFRPQQEAIVNSLAGAGPESIIDFDRTQANLRESRIPRPFIYRLLGELSQAGILVKYPPNSNYVFRIDRSFFTELGET